MIGTTTASRVESQSNEASKQTIRNLEQGTNLDPIKELTDLRFLKMIAREEYYRTMHDLLATARVNADRRWTFLFAENILCERMVAAAPVVVTRSIHRSWLEALARDF